MRTFSSKPSSISPYLQSRPIHTMRIFSSKPSSISPYLGQSVTNRYNRTSARPLPMDTTEPRLVRYQQLQQNLSWSATNGYNRTSAGPLPMDTTEPRPVRYQWIQQNPCRSITNGYNRTSADIGWPMWFGALSTWVSRVVWGIINLGVPYGMGMIH
jgi:hypothetical protein